MSGLDGVEHVLPSALGEGEPCLDLPGPCFDLAVSGFLADAECGGLAEVGGFALAPVVLDTGVEQEQPAGVDQQFLVLAQGHAAFELLGDVLQAVAGAFVEVVGVGVRVGAGQLIDAFLDRLQGGAVDAGHLRAAQHLSDVPYACAALCDQGARVLRLRAAGRSVQLPGAWGESCEMAGDA
ncbi:hypothetical protein ACQ4WX_30495 [Streptomyces lasalocidi]